MAEKDVVITGTMRWREDESPSPGDPPSVWDPAFPTPPIHLPPNSPPVIIWPSPGHPAHPIVIPLPPVIWGPTDPRPEHPIVIPPIGIWGPDDPRPSHPIEIPPSIWGGGSEPMPTPPIVIPAPPPGLYPPGNDDGIPNHPVAGVPGPGGKFTFYYTPQYGWVMVPSDGSWADVIPPSGK